MPNDQSHWAVKRLENLARAKRILDMKLKPNRREKDPLKLLKWVVEKFLAPFPANYDEHNRVWTWYCNGCNGQYTAERAEEGEQAEPTTTTFGHLPGCKYVAILKLVEK